MFFNFKLNYFQLWFFYISAAETTEEIVTTTVSIRTNCVPLQAASGIQNIKSSENSFSSFEKFNLKIQTVRYTLNLKRLKPSTVRIFSHIVHQTYILLRKHIQMIILLY